MHCAPGRAVRHADVQVGAGEVDAPAHVLVGAGGAGQAHGIARLDPDLGVTCPAEQRERLDRARLGGRSDGLTGDADRDPQGDGGTHRTGCGVDRRDLLAEPVIDLGSARHGDSDP
jgi:hypothetical protein